MVSNNLAGSAIEKITSMERTAVVESHFSAGNRRADAGPQRIVPRESHRRLSTDILSVWREPTILSTVAIEPAPSRTCSDAPTVVDTPRTLGGGSHLIDRRSSDRSASNHQHHSAIVAKTSALAGGGSHRRLSHTDTNVAAAGPGPTTHSKYSPAGPAGPRRSSETPPPLAGGDADVAGDVVWFFRRPSSAGAPAAAGRLSAGVLGTRHFDNSRSCEK